MRLVFVLMVALFVAACGDDDGAPMSTCGDAFCASGETCSTCASDCGACGACGDGICAAGETCGGCAVDCGACMGDAGPAPRTDCDIEPGVYLFVGSPTDATTDADCMWPDAEATMDAMEQAVFVAECPDGCTCGNGPVPTYPSCIVTSSIACTGTTIAQSAVWVSPTEVAFSVRRENALGLVCEIAGVAERVR